MTEFDEIIDLALISVEDYRVRKLYNDNEEYFQSYCDGFLIRAALAFDKCRQSLEFNTSERYFEADLTFEEKKILANLWVVEWYTKNNQDYAMYRQHLQNAGSFKNHSEAQGLKEHSTYADKLREEVDRQIVAYQLGNIDFYMRFEGSEDE